MDSSLLQALSSCPVEIAITFLICGTIVELSKFFIHKRRVSKGLAHDSLTRDEHRALMKILTQHETYPARDHLEHTIKTIAVLEEIRDNLILSLRKTGR